MTTGGARVVGAASRALYAWIAAGKPYPRGAGRLLRQYAWSRWFFGMNLYMQRKVNPPQPLSATPLFVLGLWRSGTTFLHELLAASPELCTPRTWQCMAPSTFAITGRPPGDLAIKRPMDDFTISADSPQEDEFVLLALGAPSVYRGFIDPRRLGELQALLDPDGPAATTPVDAAWLEFLQTVNELEGTARRLALKSPNHTFRIRTLLTRFPDAPLIWITRDVTAVLHSNLKMWRQMTSLYGLAVPADGDIERFVLCAIERAAQVLERLAATLPREQLVVVSLEALRAAPSEGTLAILRRLGLASDEDVAAAVTQAAMRRSEVKADDYRGLSLPAGAAEALARLAAAQDAALRTHGLAA